MTGSRRATALECTPIVVAGGRSRRFGDADKLVVELDGRALVDRVVAAAREATGHEPVVATRDRKHERRLADAVDAGDPVFVRDDPRYEGPLAGVAAALERVETPWVFVCGGDMPWLTPEAVRPIADRAERLRVAGVVPTREGHPEPLHGIYRAADLRDAVAGACARTSLRGVVKRLSPLVTVPTTHADPALARSLTDIDERDDLPNHDSTISTP